ncbi:hypothetical protein EDD86DRAFT_187059, partial [Gorgonomyces haynaldii]
EKMGNSSRTETSVEFNKLQEDTNSRKKCLERIWHAFNLYFENLSKKKDAFDEKGKKLIQQLTANAMLGFGSILSDESQYARVLLKVGQAEERLAIERAVYADQLKDGYLSCLERDLEAMKEYDKMVTKLENRRLDFDAKMNRMQRAKKESPELEEETRVAQSKYEETLTQITELMIQLNSNDDMPCDALLRMVDDELSYHQRSLQILTDLKQSLGTSRPVSLAKRNSFKRSASDNSIMQQQEVTRKVPAMAITSQMATITVGGVERQHSVPSMNRQSTIPKRYVRAVFDFDAENDGELSLRKGDVIQVLKEIDEGWWQGQSTDGRTGMFPSNYVE